VGSKIFRYYNSSSDKQDFHGTQVSRKASGADVLNSARKLAVNAETVGELRMALAVVLPTEFGLSLEQVAGLVGKSVSWVSRSRSQIIAQSAARESVKRQGHGGRRNQILSREEELPFMIEFCSQLRAMRELGAGRGDGRISPEDWHLPFQLHVKAALDKRAGRPVSIATTYNIMRRTSLQRFGRAGSWRWKVFA
jgi:hypothetical protein